MKEQATYYGVQLANGQWWRGRVGRRHHGPVTFGFRITLYLRREDAHQAAAKAGLRGGFVVREVEMAAGAVLVSVVDHQAEKMKAAPQLRTVPGPR